MKTPSLIFLAILCGCAFSVTRSNHDLQTQAFRGAADASAVELLEQDWFVVADDEDNYLRIYHRDQPEAPVRSLDLGPFLRAGGKGSEVDLEGSARLGDTIFWISSHGRNASGKTAETRHRFLATKVGMVAGVPWIHPVGATYTDLVSALLKDPRFSSLGLAQASERAPKDPGGFNIEALVGTPSGSLLIGFRNPVPQGKALLIPLLNPFEVIAGQQPKFGDALLIPLGGHGIRGMTPSEDGYWVLAGPVDSNGEIQLFRWSGGPDAPESCSDVDLSGFKAEGITVLREGQGGSLLVVSDDGTQRVGGKEAKRLKDPRLKSFRVATIPVENPRAQPTPASLTPSISYPLALNPVSKH